MIRGTQKREQAFTQKTQVNYRALDALNQSMLRLFDSDPVKFFEEFKLGKKRKQKKNASLIIGDLVDFYLLECRGDEKQFHNRLHEQFALFDGTKGSGQVFTLAEYIFEEVEASLNEDNEVTIEFETAFADAFRRIQGEEKYKGKTLEKALIDFTENGKTYYNTLLENIGKTIVDESLINKSLSVATSLLYDEFTKKLFIDDGSTEWLTKFPIEWIYKTKDNKEIKCKSEIDAMEVDHEHKIIYLRDLKTTYDNESFEYSYIKNSYYLQNAFYYLAVKYWAEQQGFGDYTITPMEFIVGDTSANNRRPIVYKTSMKDVTNGLHGFSLRGTLYRGIHELIEEISWCENSNIWNCSKLLFDSKGVLELNIKYD